MSQNRSFPPPTPERSKALRRMTIRTGGRRTTVALEPDYWDILGEVAASEGISISQLCGEIASAAPTANLTAQLRLRALRHVRPPPTLPGRTHTSGQMAAATHLLIGAGESINSFVLPRYLHALPGWSVTLLSQGATEPERAVDADIYVVAQREADDLDGVSRDLRGQCVGTMRMQPWVSPAYLAKHGRPRSAEELRYHAIANHREYGRLRGLDPWNGVVGDLAEGGRQLYQTDNTSALLKLVQLGLGIGLLPTYTGEFAPTLEPLDVRLPEMPVRLWLFAHRSVLRDPAARRAYDRLAACFMEDPWLGDAPRT